MSGVHSRRILAGREAEKGALRFCADPLGMEGGRGPSRTGARGGWVGARTEPQPNDGATPADRWWASRRRRDGVRFAVGVSALGDGPSASESPRRGPAGCVGGRAKLEYWRELR